MRQPDQAEHAWNDRQTRARAEEAVKIWQNVAERAPDDIATRLRLTEAYAYLGDLLVQSGESPLAAWDAGSEVARQVLALQGNEATATPLFWFGVNLHKAAWARGLASALRQSDTIVEALRQSLKRDATYYHGAARSFLASHLCRLPPGLGGDMDEAKRLFLDAQQDAPQFFVTSVMYAYDWALRAQDRETFEATLQAVVKAPQNSLPEVAPEQHLARRQAAELLEATRALFGAGVSHG